MPFRFCRPSASERWTNCPRSVALTERLVDDTRSWASVRGTILHAAAEAALNASDGGPLSVASLRYRYDCAYAVHKDDAAAVDYQQSEDDLNALIMAHDQAVEIVKGATEVLTEVQVPPPSWLPVHKGPTMDVVYHGTDTAGIIDYKFGSHPVRPDATQLLIYADTLYANTDYRGPLDLWLVQPPNAPATVRVTRDELRERLKPCVAAAFEAQVLDATDDPADYTAGSWCHFCPAKTFCPLHRDKRRAKVREAFAHLIDQEHPE